MTNILICTFIHLYLIAKHAYPRTVTETLNDIYLNLFIDLFGTYVYNIRIDIHCFVFTLTARVSILFGLTFTARASVFFVEVEIRQLLFAFLLARLAGGSTSEISKVLGIAAIHLRMNNYSSFKVHN